MGDTGSIDFAALGQKYAVEREKRIRPDSNEQYVELDDSGRWNKLAQDPWVDHAALNAVPPVLQDGDEIIKFLILGAGYGALLYAVRLIQAGFKAEDIRLVDIAGGFGGTWYWNRYPGLMCDVESYIYMPLLEETGYMPKHKYSYGTELREYAEIIAKKWDLKGAFRTRAKSCVWDEGAKRWITKLEQNRGPEGILEMAIRSQFIINANGVINYPKAPKGLENYQGDVVHTARWDYGLTGGSPENPTLTGLQGKRVGVVGTGTTAIQVVPELSKWAKELYVFQRTPSSVAERGQRPTDPEEWRTKIATGPRWHIKRNENFNDCLSGNAGGENLVNDQWTKMKGYKALIGGPHKTLTMEDIPNYIGMIMALDYEHSNSTRERVDAIITKDKVTAESLKAWYPGWCKRPAFHDDYLPTFNKPNVHLVDTDGKGVSGSTATGLLVGDKEYPIDVLILSTGYRSEAKYMADPAMTSNMTFHGRGGKSISEKWQTNGPSTLHGVISNGFPNLFLTGPMQTGAAANFAHSQDILAQHVAYLAARAVERGGDNAEIESSVEAEEGWTGLIMAGALCLAGLGICTPGSYNREGQQGDPAETAKLMRGAPYPQGMNAFSKVLRDWRESGKLEGIVIS